MKDSERRFRELFDKSPDAIFLEDLTGEVLDVNPAACRLHGMARENIIGKNVLELIPSDKRDQAVRDFAMLVKGELDHVEGFSQAANGDAIPVEIRVSHTEYSGKPALLLHVRDITERKRAETAQRQVHDMLEKRVQERTVELERVNAALRAEIVERMQTEEALRNTEERYRFLYEYNPSMYFTVNTAGRVLSVNRFGAEQLGYAAAELIGRSVLDVFHENDKISVQQQLAACLQNPHQVHDWEFRKVRKDGSLMWVKEHARCVQSPDGQFIVLIVCEDITQRKQAEEELQTSRKRLRALSANLYSLQEKERSAISREVHDEFGQVLTSLKMDLILLERKIKTATAAELPSLFAAIAPMKETINTTIDKLTGLITELRPMVFSNLLAAAEWQTEEFQKRSGLAVEFTAGVDEIPLDQEHATAVFRIIQESLTNIARHAQAGRVQFEIYEDPPNIFIEIIDDGVGVAPEKLAATEAFGILGMRERALIFGGDVEIISAPGKGTTVKIRIPKGNGHDQDSDC